MHIRNVYGVIFVAGVGLFRGWPSAAAAPDLSIFDYDKQKPLALEEKVVQELPDVFIYDVSFDGGHGDRASGYFVLPRKGEKHPAVVFMHELGASRTEFLNEALQLAQSEPRLASVLLDAPWQKPKPWQRSFDSAKRDNDRELQMEAITNARRAVDFLISRPTVARETIGFVGHSYGANWGSILTVAEPRLKLFVLISGVPSVTRFLQSEGKSDQGYIDSIRAFDPELYLPKMGGKQLFLQFATYDLSIARVEGEKFVNLTAGNKEVRWYDCGHEMLDPRAIQERVEYLKKHLQSAK